MSLLETEFCFNFKKWIINYYQLMNTKFKNKTAFWSKSNQPFIRFPQCKAFKINFNLSLAQF